MSHRTLAIALTAFAVLACVTVLGCLAGLTIAAWWVRSAHTSDLATVASQPEGRPSANGPFASLDDSDKAVFSSFKVKIACHSDMKVQGELQKIDTDMELCYTWKREGRERILTLDSLLVKVSIDGKQSMNRFMSRAKVANTEHGTTNEVPVEEAPGELKMMLQDTFGAPMCKLQLDEDGNEVSRTVIAGLGAKELIDNGVIANAILFHPQFLRDRDEWQSDTSISMGNGGYAKGKLTYRRLTGEKRERTFKVSGTLTNESFKYPNLQLTVKKARYIVSGEQTYDLAEQEWVSGSHSVSLSFQVAADGEIIGSTNGTIAVDFEKLSGKR